jgi:hypothetical protein
MIPFKELPEERQREIVENGMPEEWHDFTIEKIQEELSEYGFENTEVSYSGWHSQGDGASFTCESVCMSTLYNKIKGEDFDFQFNRPGIDTDEEDIFVLENMGIDTENPMETLLENGLWYAGVKRIDSRHLHENTVRFEIDYENYHILVDPEDTSNYHSFDVTQEESDEIEKLTQYFNTYVSELVKTKCKEIYKRLYKDWHAWIEEELKYLKEENSLYPERASYAY